MSVRAAGDGCFASGEAIVRVRNRTFACRRLWVVHIDKFFLLSPCAASQLDGLTSPPGAANRHLFRQAGVRLSPRGEHGAAALRVSALPPPSSLPTCKGGRVGRACCRHRRRRRGAAAGALAALRHLRAVSESCHARRGADGEGQGLQQRVPLPGYPPAGEIDHIGAMVVDMVSHLVGAKSQFQLFGTATRLNI